MWGGEGGDSMMVIIPSDDQKDAYHQGASDYRNGKSILDCPYPSGARDFRGRPTLLPFYWTGGWWDERKKYPRKGDKPYEEAPMVATRDRQRGK